MSNNEMINAWDSENATSEELTDEELAAVQGGFGDINLGLNLDINAPVQVAVVAGNFGVNSIDLGQLIH